MPKRLFLFDTQSEEDEGDENQDVHKERIVDLVIDLAPFGLWFFAFHGPALAFLMVCSLLSVYRAGCFLIPSLHQTGLTVKARRRFEREMGRFLRRTACV